MAGKFELKAIISAVDKLSPSLKSINRTAKLTRKAISDIASAGRNISSSIGLPIAAASAVTVEAVRRMVDGFADYGSKIHDTATKTGLAAKQLQEAAYAAKLEGVEFETLTGGTVKLSKAIAGAASGKNKEAAALFKKLGINLRDSNGHLKDAGTLMPEVADGLNRIKNPAQRTAATLALFGKSGAELYPFLAIGSKGMREAAEEAQALGLILSDDDLRNADDLGDNFDRIRASAQGLSNTIGSKLAPVLNPLIKSLIEWYKVNRELIAQTISEAVIKFVNALKQIEWDKVIEGVRSFARSLSSLADFVGGWSNLMIGFFVLANAHIILAIFEIVTALGALSRILLVAAANMARFVAVQVAAAFGNFVTAIRAGYTAMQAFNLVLLANPIGVVITAVAALAAAAYLVYSHWEPIKKWFSDMTESIAGYFNAIPDAFISAIEKIKSYLPDLSIITDTAKSAWNAVTGGGAPTASNDNYQAPGQNQNLFLAPKPKPSLLSNGSMNAVTGQPAAGQVKGDVTVKFENAPKGLRVTATQSSQSAANINTSVGYSSTAMGMP